MPPATPWLRLTHRTVVMSFGHASTLPRPRRSPAARHRASRRQQERGASHPRRHPPRRRSGGARQHPAHPRRRDHARDPGSTSAPRSSGPGRTWSGSTREACGPKPLDPALCARIRASILLAGPLLARFGTVTLPPPGGDVIGRRRVDTHFLALEQLGAYGHGRRPLRARGQGARSAPTSSSTSRASPAPRTR